MSRSDQGVQPRAGRMSIASRLVETGGRSTGFDYLRILLATAVIGWHAFTSAYGLDFAYHVMTGPVRPVVSAILPMFFALSGFLVAGSLERNTAISTFVGLRFLRIAPALAVEVLLSAFVLGPLLTTVPLDRYFSDPVFFKYLLNVTGYIHFRLPGLFANNPFPFVVNSQLWTVPWELNCYLALVGLALLRVVKRRRVFLAVTLAATVAILLARVAVTHDAIDQERGVPGEALLMAYLSASVIYAYRDRIPWTAWLFLPSAAVLAALLLIPGGDCLVGFPAAYATIYLGLFNLRKIGLLRGADYSYGLYLYGFVIQQAIVSSGPWARHWYVNFPVTMAVGSVFAAFSWYAVEKPALGFRRYLPRLESLFARVRLGAVTLV